MFENNKLKYVWNNEAAAELSPSISFVRALSEVTQEMLQPLGNGLVKGKFNLFTLCNKSFQNAIGIFKLSLSCQL